MADTPEQARRAAELWCQKLKEEGGLTVREAGDRFLAHLRETGVKDLTLVHRDRDLRQFFGEALHEALHRMTPDRCAALYEQLRVQPSERRGRVVSVDTQLCYMKNARRFLDFCVAEKWLRENPMAALKAVGRKRKGKAQLRLDEARQLYTTCLERARGGDEGAAAVLVGLLMACRPGEITSRTARDLDDGGAILWIDDTDGFQVKTDGSRRPVQVPQVLRPVLRELARDRAGAALLWPAADGLRHRHGWVNRQVERLCKLAGVPRVCAHSLRGLQATTALHAGATPELVASVLGHRSVEVTLSHYAAPGAEQASDTAARVRLLGRDRA